MAQASRSYTKGFNKTKHTRVSTEASDAFTRYSTQASERELHRGKMQAINPFLTPRSVHTYERPSSPPKTSRSFLGSRDQALNKKSVASPLFRNTSSSDSFKSMHTSLLKFIKKTSTDQTPSTQNTRSASPRGRMFYEENRSMSKQILQKGAEVFETKTQSKILEQEIKSLENRVDKLEKEEQSVIKKLNKTQNNCEKIVEAKLRHQNELIDKEYRKRQRMAELALLRKELMESKMKLNQSILKSIVNNVEVKNQQKKEVKKILADAKEVYIKETEQRNKTRDKIINEIQELRRRLVQGKKDKEEADKEYSLVIHHQEKIDTEKQKQEKMNQRLQGLTIKEEVLLEKLRASTTLQESAYQKMEKLYSMRVSIDKPLDLP